jgi:glycosyltransferase involved in cell wall biosynthesis
MIIAVNTGFKGDGQPADEFIYGCLVHLAEKNRAHEFIYLFDRPLDRMNTFSKNVTVVIVGPQPRTRLLRKYQLNYKIPALLKKYKADVLLNMNTVCAGRTKVPQCSFVTGLPVKKQMSASLEKSKVIITTSLFSKKIIADHYKANEDMIDTVTPAIDEMFKPVTWKEKETVKEKYAEGREYFLAHSNDNLLNLLKAFSFFKKRQKSNMLLLISGKTGSSFKDALRTFKFRNEVKLLELLSNEQLAEVTASAYALVHAPVSDDDLGIIPMTAMRSDVAAVCSDKGGLPELLGEASLFFDPNNFEDIADKMMLVFKDEDRVKELVSQGKKQAAYYNWDKTCALLWRSIQKTAGN